MTNGQATGMPVIGLALPLAGGNAALGKRQIHPEVALGHMTHFPHFGVESFP